MVESFGLVPFESVKVKIFQKFFLKDIAKRFVYDQFRSLDQKIILPKKIQKLAEVWITTFKRPQDPRTLGHKFLYMSFFLVRWDLFGINSIGIISIDSLVLEQHNLSSKVALELHFRNLSNLLQNLILTPISKYFHQMKMLLFKHKYLLIQGLYLTDLRC